MAQANEQATGAIARDIGGKLPGATDLPPAGGGAARRAARIPLGIAYYPKDALGLTGVGPVAVGYYKDGDKRWRDVAIVRADADAREGGLPRVQAQAGRLPVKGLGDEAVQVIVQEAPDRAKAEYIVARKGTHGGGGRRRGARARPGDPERQARAAQADEGREASQKLGAFVSLRRGARRLRGVERLALEAVVRQACAACARGAWPSMKRVVTGSW